MIAGFCRMVLRFVCLAFYGLFCSLRNPQCLEQCLAYKGYSVNICWMNEERMSASFLEFADVFIKCKT